jgi:hypothetical protein
MSFVYAELSACCQNDETGINATISIMVRFESNKMFEMYEGDMFDNLIEPINAVLPGDWRVDDIIEINDIYSTPPTNRPVQLCIIDKSGGYTKTENLVPEPEIASSDEEES